jgi:hypothetical protein
MTWEQWREYTGQKCPTCSQGAIYYDPAWKAYYCDNDKCNHAYYEDEEVS